MATSKTALNLAPYRMAQIATTSPPLNLHVFHKTLCFMPKWLICRFRHSVKSSRSISMAVLGVHTGVPWEFNLAPGRPPLWEAMSEGLAIASVGWRPFYPICAGVEWNTTWEPGICFWSRFMSGLPQCPVCPCATHANAERF